MQVFVKPDRPIPDDWIISMAHDIRELSPYDMNKLGIINTKGLRIYKCLRCKAHMINTADPDFLCVPTYSKDTSGYKDYKLVSTH